MAVFGVLQGDAALHEQHQEQRLLGEFLNKSQKEVFFLVSFFTIGVAEGQLKVRVLIFRVYFDCLFNVLYRFFKAFTSKVQTSNEKLTFFKARVQIKALSDFLHGFLMALKMG